VSALEGKRIVVTRPRERAGRLYEELIERGAHAILMPTIEVVPMGDYARLDEAIGALKRYDWLVLTSTYGVQVFWERVVRLGLDPRTLGVSIAAIGPATSATLRSRGFTVHYVPDEFVAERILDGLGDIAGKHFLLPLAEIARKTLRDELQALGGVVDEIPVYRTVPAHITPEALRELREGVDAVTFTSSSTVRNFHEVTGGPPNGAGIICIGPITARTAEELGYRVDLVAEDYSTDGLLTALEDYFSRPAQMQVPAPK
jgi:uroporphyrinogen-III synthase